MMRLIASSEHFGDVLLLRKSHPVMMERTAIDGKAVGLGRARFGA